MRRIITVWMAAAALASTLTVYPLAAFAQETLVLVKDIERVEHLNLLEQLWKAVDNVKQRSVISQTDWPELKVPVDFVGGVTVVHFSDTGFTDESAIKAPVGYTICHAAIKEPLITCNGSITSVYRTAADPDSKNVDGLHLNISFDKPDPAATQPRPGKCWLSGTIIVTFVVQSKRSAFKCAETGATAFHYEKNDAKKDKK